MPAPLFPIELNWEPPTAEKCIHFKRELGESINSYGFLKEMLMLGLGQGPSHGQGLAGYQLITLRTRKHNAKKVGRPITRKHSTEKSEVRLFPILALKCSVTFD